MTCDASCDGPYGSRAKPGGYSAAYQVRPCCAAPCPQLETEFERLSSTASSQLSSRVRRYVTTHMFVAHDCRLAQSRPLLLRHKQLPHPSQVPHPFHIALRRRSARRRVLTISFPGPYQNWFSGARVPMPQTVKNDLVSFAGTRATVR